MPKAILVFKSIFYWKSSIWVVYRFMYLYDISIDFEAKPQCLMIFGWILQIWVIVDKTEKLPNLMVYNYNSCRTLWWTVKDYFILFMWRYFSTVLKGQFWGQFYVHLWKKWHDGRYKYVVWNLLTFVYFTYVSTLLTFVFT